jgi:hypothetical protein
MSIFSSVIIAQMLRDIQFNDPEFINSEKQSIKDELLALIFQIFGVYYIHPFYP